MDGGGLRGAALYGAAVALLAAGVAGWFAARPDPPEPAADSGIAALRATATAALPADGGADVHTVVVRPGQRRSWQLDDVASGRYEVRMVCAGAGQAFVRLYPEADHLTSLSCGAQPVPSALAALAAGRVYVEVASDSPEPVVVRWQLVRVGS